MKDKEMLWKNWKFRIRKLKQQRDFFFQRGAHFSEDAKNVIRCWHSTDVAACPGSGKTTVLLAKLKLLADRMPFNNGAGICVLSHTNVAVDEIKERLSDYADKLISYPNYIGTIQSFVDKFVTMPYLRNSIGRNVQAVDDVTYAQYMLSRMKNNRKYSALEYMTKNNFATGGQFTERIEHTQALHLRADGALCVGKQKRALAGAGNKSVIQYSELVNDILKEEGIIKYQDAYLYASKAIDNLPETYTSLFSSRFRYVFIDEYQDCDNIQRKAIDAIFNATDCTVIKIGDPDQAIYNSSEDETLDWVPKEGFLPIMSSCRYSQEIADVICSLRKDKESIVTLAGNTGAKPVLLIFEPEKIDRVIGGFISVLDKQGLIDNKGTYKAIGAIRKKESSGLKISSYWVEFNGSAKKKSEYNYWVLIDDIIVSLSEGKLYKTERIIRKLLCRIFHYAKVRHPIMGKDFSMSTIKKFLNDQYQEPYHQWIFELSMLKDVKIESVDQFIRQKINDLYKHMNSQEIDIFKCLPEHFLNKEDIESEREKHERNILIDSIRGRKIEFDTIHGVKGETHDATL